jgi:FkbM family methyltransferase
MTKLKLYEDYIDKKISKHTYIREIFKHHQSLFEYSKILIDSDIESIKITEKQIIAEVNGISRIKMIIDTSDLRFVPLEIINFKKFEPEFAELIFLFAKNSENIIDIGANIGWYSLNFNSLEMVKTIHAFEPIPKTFNYLLKHIELNNSKKIISNNFALSESNGEVEFLWHDGELGASSMVNIRELESINNIKCKTMKLDDYVEQKNIKVDFIKCDVEGSELLVFKGAEKVLNDSKPIIFCEMLRIHAKKFDFHPNETILLLENYGYKCFSRNHNNNFEEIKEMTNETEETNFFFLHKTKHLSQIKTILSHQ